MKRSATKTILITAICSILVATVAVAATRLQSENSKEKNDTNVEASANPTVRSDSPAERAMVVETTVAKTTTLTDTVTANGTTAAIREVTFSAEIPGKIQSLRADLGDTVRKGQVLALIDRDTLAAEQDRAKAAYALAKSTHARFAGLGDGVVSQQQLDETRSALTTAEVGLSIANNNVRKGVVRANLSGIVTAKYKEKAEYTTPGAPILHIVDYRTIVVEADIAESDVAAVSQGAEAAVRIDALNETFKGTVQAVLPVADKASKTFTVRVEIPNPDLKILVGMSAQVRIEAGTEKDVILVPQDVVVEERDGRSVYIARGNTALKMPVTLGSTYRDQVVVTDGIAPGDQIITLGHRRLEDGQHIEIAQR